MADTIAAPITNDLGYVNLGTGPLRLEIKSGFLRAFYGGATNPSAGFSGTTIEKAEQVTAFHTEQQGDVPFPWTHNVWVYNPIPDVPVQIALTAE